MKYVKYVIITGCSTGIGYETAKYLKEKKYKVIVSCRKNKDVKRLSKEFDHSIQLNISSSKSVNQAFDLIKKITKTIQFTVYFVMLDMVNLVQLKI